jgi:adenosine kinase
MRIAVTGSIATDHLMVFPGRISDQLVADQLHNVSLSFLVDGLEIRRGGVGPNICFGLGQLGLRPLLVGAAGKDFDEYRAWLEQHGVDTAHVLVSPHLQTARFICLTDTDNNQIASFYTGAMADARLIDLRTLPDHSGLDLVLIGADDPAAMVRHTETCRALDIPFAADPSQQLARIPGEEIRGLVEGAAYLFGNEYERELLGKHTGWSPDDIRDRVGIWVTTLAADGVRVESAAGGVVEVPAVPVSRIADPTGCGDAFRAGFLAALAWGQSLERAGQLGCTMAALALETVGTQAYTAQAATVLDRLGEAYGTAAAADFGPWLAPAQPRPETS